MKNDLLCYKTLPVWGAATLPEGFRRMHNTQEGTWAQLQVLQGTLDFAFLDAAGQVVSQHRFSPQQQPPRIAPQQWHRIVATSDDVQCQLSFLCAPEDYFAKKHSLTRTHSEVIEAVQVVPAGRALDLGCGRGRNTLYLRLKGFTVEAWDQNPQALEILRTLATAETLDDPASLVVRQVDLNAVQVTGQYDFILSTVVMMFLQPTTVPRLLAQMQAATAPGGYNLIVAAMNTPEHPCQEPFPFTFTPGQLREQYAGWELLKYNEDTGSLHRKDPQGNPVVLQFATLLARRPG